MRRDVVSLGQQCQLLSSRDNKAGACIVFLKIGRAVRVPRTASYRFSES